MSMFEPSYDTPQKQINLEDEKKQAHEEFSTRVEEFENYQRGLEKGDVEAPRATPSPYADLPHIPFKDPRQNFALINIAHRHQRPCSNVPQFRICGAFEHRVVDGRNLISEYVEQVGGQSAYGDATLLTTAMHTKFLICTSWEKQKDDDYVQRKIDAVTLAYDKNNQYHKQEFEENRKRIRDPKPTPQSVAEKKTNLRKKPTETSRKELLDKKFKEFCQKGRRTGGVSRNAEVRNQTVCVVSIIPDLTEPVLKGREDPEPVIIIWACLPDERWAKHYIYDSAASKVGNMSLDVFNMYEWIAPTELKVNDVEEEFRDPTLNKIIKNQKQQKAAVMKFEDWFKEQQREVPVVESTIYADGRQEVRGPSQFAPPSVQFSASTMPRLKPHENLPEKLGEFKEVAMIHRDEQHMKFDFADSALETRPDSSPDDFRPKITSKPLFEKRSSSDE